MRLDVIYGGGLIGFCLLALSARFWAKKFASTAKSENSLTAYEIPKVIKRLEQSVNDGDFVVFLLVPPDSKDGKAVHLQYSIEDGVVGFDWVLISPPNIADQEKIKAFASRLGHKLEEREMNNTRYLRTTGSDISDFGKSIIKDFYKMDLSIKLDMVTEGFEWQP